MRSENSSIGRMLFAVLTIAVGLAAMKSQSDFLMGCFVTLAVGWIVRALGVTNSGRGRSRFSSMAFVGAASISLFVGFGPWSDATDRDEFFKVDTYQAHMRRKNALWPTTRAFVWLSFQPTFRTSRPHFL